MQLEERLLTDRAEIIEQFPVFGERVRHWGKDVFVYVVGDEIVAEGELELSPEDRSIEIKMIQTKEERKGYGRKFVNYLKALDGYEELWGESVPDAVPFWSKNGAVFEPTAFNEFMELDEYEEGFLIPFTIKC